MEQKQKGRVPKMDVMPPPPPSKAQNIRFVTDNESYFLSVAVDNYIYWKEEIKRLETAGKDATREKEYALAFKGLLNAFTNE